MKEKGDILLAMYQEHCTHGRHHEVQRTTMTNTFVAVSGAVLAFIGSNGVTREKWPLAVFLIVIGIFGALFSAKQTERSGEHMDIAGAYRDALEQTAKPAFDGKGMRDIIQEVRGPHADKFKLLAPLHLYGFYIALYLIISALGLTLLVYIVRLPPVTQGAPAAPPATRLIRQ